MKISKTSSLLRLVAFLLITVVFIGIVGVVSSEGAGNTPEEDGQANQEGNTQNPPATDIPTASVRYENYLSGLSCSKEESERFPVCYVMNPEASLYGLANADLTVECPVEFGQSRLLVYTNQTALAGKIGAIAPWRSYMSYVFSSFGGIVVHSGCDDTVDYDTRENQNPTIDLSKSNAYSYSEGRGAIYTNGALMSNALESLRASIQQEFTPELPYAFTSTYSNLVYGSFQGQNVAIPFGTQNNVRLLYDSLSGEYRCEQNGKVRIDGLSGESLYYKNVFILFTDSMTYEKANTTELVLDIRAGGQGYYFTNGTMMKLNWALGEDGGLIFYELSGQKLVINRGTTYIAFYKTTEKSLISIY